MAIDEVWAELGRPRRSQPRLATSPALAGGLAVGIVIGRWSSPESQHAWLILAAALLAAALIAIRPPIARIAAIDANRRRLIAVTLMGCGAAGLGAAWLHVRQNAHPPDALVLRLPEEPALIRVSGVVIESPTRWERPSGDPLTHPGRGGPVLRFTLDAEAVIGSDGEPHPASGRLRIYVRGERLPGVQAGARIEALGWAARVAPPLNPGQFDARRYFEERGFAGRLSAADPALITILEERVDGPVGYWRWLRGAAHERARRALLGIEGNAKPENRGPDVDAAAPHVDFDVAPAQPESEALLEALLLGRRSGTLVDVRDAMAGLGIAHLLAISGLHLGLLAAMAYGMLRWIGVHERWAAGILIALVLAYLVVLEVRAPIIRAAVMTILALMGALVGRRWDAGNLLAAGAVVILIWRPIELFSPGFQLTFAVVAAILYLREPLQRRLFGRADPDEWRLSRVLWHKLAQWIAVAIAAWLVSGPIALAHFGSVGLLAIPLSVIGVPIIAGLLGLGVVRLAIGLAWPGGVDLIARWTDPIVALLLDVVRWMDELPFATAGAPAPSPAWAILAIGLIVLALGGPLWWRRWKWRMRRRWSWRIISVLAIAFILAWPWTRAAYANWRQRDLLRIDTLAVGDGACHIVRSGGRTLLIDAGSGTHDGIGRNVIAPALRELGVRRIDLLCITHADLDHFSGTIDLMRELPIDAIAMAEDVYARSTAPPAPPEPDEAAPPPQDGDEAAQSAAISIWRPGVELISVVVEEARTRDIPIVVHGAGDSMKLGAASVHWIHPPRGEDAPIYERDNDGSLVALVKFAGRRILFTGDAEAEAIEDLMARWPDARADVLELPHHGAFHDGSNAMVRWLEPSIVLQSAGTKRWRADQWTSVLRGIEDEKGSPIDRRITARDGMVSIIIGEDGRISVRPFRTEQQAVEAIGSGRASAMSVDDRPRSTPPQ